MLHVHVQLYVSPSLTKVLLPALSVKLQTMRCQVAQPITAFAEEAGGCRPLSLKMIKRGKLRCHYLQVRQKRSLQNNCVSAGIYEGIRAALDEMTNTITDLGDRGHFIGGIVRLTSVSRSAIYFASFKHAIFAHQLTDHHLYSLT